MIFRTSVFASACAALLLGACASVPSGPSVMVLPGTGRSFDQFRADDYECRQFASAQVGGTDAQQAASDAGVRSAVLGTAVGAAAGALIGGGHEGAAVGAGTGLIVGTAAGSGAAHGSAYSLQQRYDIGYQQCMYAKGNRIPVRGRFETSQVPSRRSYTPPPPPPPPR